MIGDTFSVGEKSFTIKSNFTVKDKNNLNTLQNKFNDIIDAKLDTETLISEQLRISMEQDLLMGDMIKKVLGISQDELDNFSYPDELRNVFQTMLQICTVPKKKESKPSDLSISQETPVSPK